MKLALFLPALPLMLIGYLPAYAEIQLNQDKSCHIPMDQYDPDIELKTMCDEVDLLFTRQDTVVGFGRIFDVDKSYFEELPRFNSAGGIECTMTDNGGTTYATDIWRMIARGSEIGDGYSIFIQCIAEQQ